MLSGNEAKEIVLCMDGQQFTGKECFITRFNFDIDNGIERVDLRSPGSRLIKDTAFYPTHQMITGSLEFVVKDAATFKELFFGDVKAKKKIRKKLVEECSVEELFFAIREKAKNGTKKR